MDIRIPAFASITSQSIIHNKCLFGTKHGYVLGVMKSPVDFPKIFLDFLRVHKTGTHPCI